MIVRIEAILTRHRDGSMMTSELARMIVDEINPQTAAQSRHRTARSHAGSVRVRER